jgi:hypothetical protein
MSVYARVVVLMALLSAGTALGAEAPSESFVAHGTLNVVLANENGIVVLTDSMVTIGSQQLHEPGQKLFKLDDRTVCAIAGFAFAGGPPTAPALYTESGAIIRDFSKQLAASPPQTINAKLNALAFLFNFYLSAIANIRDASHIPTPTASYTFELIIAGYDTDDIPKIGTIVLRTRDERGLDSEVQNAKIENVGPNLMWKLGGQPDIAQHLLERPESAKDDPVLQAYSASVHSDGGRSLTIDQMKAVAARLAYYTSMTYPSVGGPNQSAVLRKGDLIEVQQPTFRNAAQSPLHFSLFIDSGFEGGGVMIARGASAVFIRCHFGRQQLALDGNYFLGSEFSSVVLTYDGGITYFDNQNQTSNAVLMIGPHVKPDDPTLRHLIHDFQWSKVAGLQLRNPLPGAPR